MAQDERKRVLGSWVSKPIKKAIYALNRWLCATGYHKGGFIGYGNPQVTGKKNLEALDLNGQYAIRGCERLHASNQMCAEFYANPSDKV